MVFNGSIFKMICKMKESNLHNSAANPSIPSITCHNAIAYPLPPKCVTKLMAVSDVYEWT